MSGFFMHSRELLQRTKADRSLTAADRRVLDTAMFHTRTPGDAVALSIGFLESETGLKRRVVIQARKKLVQKKYLDSAGHDSNGVALFIIAMGAQLCTGGAQTCTPFDSDGVHNHAPEGCTKTYQTGAQSCTHIDTGNIETTTYAPNNEKPPSCSMPVTTKTDTSKPPSEQPTDSGKLDSIPLAQGTATLSPTPSPATGGKVKAPAPKVAWDGTRLIVPDVLMSSWSESYPHVDLRAAIKRAASWLLANPAKKKKNYAQFLNNWFSSVKPGSQEYIDPTEQAVSDAELIRLVKQTFDDPAEQADYWHECKCRGEYVPLGVECRPMPGKMEVAQ